MPIELKPLLGSYTDTSRAQQPFRTLSPAYKQAEQQSFNFDQYIVGTSPYAPGKIRGGFSDAEAQMLSTWQQNAIVPDAPRLYSSILNGKATPHIGTMNLDMIHPFASITMMSGQAIGQDKPLFGTEGQLGDPQSWLQERGIEPFSVGESGLPARLTDYAVAPFLAAAQMIAGLPKNQVDIPKDVKWRFQEDPTYWQVIPNANDEQLSQIATAVVARQADPTTNQWLVDQLLTQMKQDRDRLTGLTSGDERVDYTAKLRIQTGKEALDSGLLTPEEANANLFANDNTSMLAASALVIPFIGTQVAEAIQPITQQTENEWQKLTDSQRQNLLGQAGMVVGGADMVVALPILSGIGIAAGAAKGAAGLAGEAYSAYSRLLVASKTLMSAGVISATANWALQSFVPQDFNFGPVTGAGIHDYTERVDNSRPVSQSQFAGVVNAFGFWSSATFGIAGAAKVTGGTAARVAAKFGLKTTLPDLRMFAYGLGGTRMKGFMVNGLGLREDILDLSAKRLFMSELVNSIRQTRLARWSEALAGRPTGTLLDGLPAEQVAALAGHDMSQPLAGALGEAEAAMRTMKIWREGVEVKPGVFKKPGVTASDDMVRSYSFHSRNARSLDDGLAQRYVNQYSSAWVARTAGEDSPAAIRRWLEDYLPSIGGDPAGLPAAGAHPLEWWHQAMRYSYHYGFDLWPALVEHAAQGTEELGRLSVMSMRHAWKDQVDGWIRLMRGESPEAAQSAFEAAIKKVEAEDWLVHETAMAARKGESFTPTPKALADHFEDVYDTLPTRRGLPNPDSTTAGDPLNVVHRQMEDQGLWTLGFKPVDPVTGEFVAGVQTRTGQIVQTRWLDYPLANSANIELGNRGYLASKLDGVTRGFRTWRITEYQRAGLFRSLSTKTDFTPTQIEAFHNEILRLSRRNQVSPQAMGRMPANLPLTGRLAEDVKQVADAIFGPGPHYDKAGNLINFRSEIGNAYRQAYRLNATAGLTSHIKASFGTAGEAMTLGSEYLYVLWRFGLSPLFKGGEVWESAQINAMRRVPFAGDPATMPLYFRAGVGSDPGVLAGELVGETSLVQGLSYNPLEGATGNGLATHIGTHAAQEAELSQARAASSLGIYARSLPEDYQALKTRMALRAQAEDFRSRALAGEAMRISRRDSINAEIMDLTDPATGELLPNADPARLQELLRQQDYFDLPPEIQKALDAWPEGAPTEAQLARSAELQTQADTVRGGDLTGDALVGQYRQWIKDGIVPPNPQLALRDRYRELIDDLTTLRVRAKEMEQATGAEGGFHAGGVHGNTPVDWTDPVITGQPVIRDSQWATVREIDQALRSLRARMGKVYYELPSAPELSHYLEAAAESAKAPRPILRSDRIGPETLVPETHTLDPADLRLGNGQEIPYVDPIDTLPEDRGMYHATTEFDAVMAEGLLSREELLTRAEQTGTHAPEGLSAAQTNREVSLTVNYVHAKTIASRLQFASMAARGEVDGADLLAHISPFYDNVVGEDLTAIELSNVLGIRIPHNAPDEYFALEEAMARELPKSNPDAVYKALVDADAGLLRLARPNAYDYQDFSGAVLLAADREAMARIDPRQIGVVRVAARRDAAATMGADDFEITFKSQDLFTVDERIAAQPLATDEAGLLRQLRQTIDENGKPLPGLEQRGQEIVNQLEQMRQAALNPDPVATISEIASTPEGITANMQDVVQARAKAALGSKFRKQWDKVWDPVPGKLRRQSLLEIQLMKEEFPRMLDGLPAAKVFRQVAGSERNWSDFLVTDRALLDQWTTKVAHGTPEEAQAAFQKLIDHAGTDANRAAMDALYNSEEWDVVTGLWSLNVRGDQQEAFSAHFFDVYRNPLLRSINHPVLGVYPASWAYKTAREWAKFLFDNRMFGVELRMGMTPAVLIANLTRAQNVALAQGTDLGPVTLAAEAANEHGPLGSTAFVFNLLMPGDWSSLPFSLSRTLREVVRGDLNPGQIFMSNVNYLGVTRDARLISEMSTEIGSLMFGSPNQVPGWIQSAVDEQGQPLNVKPIRPFKWTDAPAGR